MRGDLVARTWSQADGLGRLLPVFALALAVLAAIVDPSSAANVLLAFVPVLAFGVWAFVPKAPLPLVALAVIVPVILAQRTGALEPLFFDVSILAFVVGRWSQPLATAAALGVVAALSPVVVNVIQNPGEIAVGIWIVGIAFPWALGRAVARQAQLAAQLEATRTELAKQAIQAERRRIARDVHDFVGHGLAAVMLQITSARHVLRRDPDSAEEALRSAEDVGRRSMQELRRTVALLRSEEESSVLPPLPSVKDIPPLVDEVRRGGLPVELRLRGDLSRVSPSVSVALYRIAQEALANAARHAPRARTVLGLELADRQARLVAETSGPLVTRAIDPDRFGFGVIGMRERATALGGELIAGPTPEGWRVSCWLPLDADDKIAGEEAP